MNRSKFKDILRPIVKESLSDYLKDSEQDMRALQAAHPQLDIDNTPTEKSDNPTKGARTSENKITNEAKGGTSESKRLKQELGKALRVSTDRISLGGGFAPKTLKNGNWLVVAQIGDEHTESHVQSDFYAKRWKTEYYVILIAQPNGSLVRVVKKSNELPSSLPKVEEASTTSAIAGYETPYAFSGAGIGRDAKKRKIAQQLGYSLVSKKRLKEERTINISKAAPINENFTPTLRTPFARALYMKLLDYLLMTDDPLYNKIRTFRRAIDGLKDAADKQQMIQYFNGEFQASSGSAWEYYK
jgi:hypothetical protein